MSAMSETPATKPSEPSMALTLIVTLVLLPAGLIVALVQGNNARQAGQSQQPIWTGFAIGAVLDVLLWYVLTR